jgi:lipid-A-disaccharide synthase
MAAADAVLCASGTVTLEATLLKRPMVVAYRLSRLTWFLVATLGWVRVRHVALPNLLADRPFVPEFLQNDARPESLGPALLKLLNGQEQDASDWHDACVKIHHQLRQDASASAASNVLSLIESAVGGR